MSFHHTSESSATDNFADATFTFDGLCQQEPRLNDLLRDVEAVTDTGGESFCANYHWFLPNGFKSRLSRLVGYGAEKPELRTSAAYDVAYDHLYRLLPDCRNCRCIAFEQAMGLRRVSGRRR
jgi:hypothetical protein